MISTDYITAVFLSRKFSSTSHLQPQTPIPPSTQPQPTQHLNPYLLLSPTQITQSQSKTATMLLLQLVLVLGFAMLSQAKMSTDFETHAVGVFEVKDFLIFNVVSTENRDPATRIANRTISCTSFLPYPEKKILLLT